jgi:predicted xylose isomerase-like sugar epimerase
MLVPLAEGGDRVEIYARGKPLAALLEAGQLQISDEAGGTVLAAGEVGLRFNNWDRVRAQRLPLLLVYAAACGALAMLFVLVVTGRLAYRGERHSLAS